MSRLRRLFLVTAVLLAGVQAGGELKARTTTPPLSGTDQPGLLAARLLEEARAATGGGAWDTAHFAHVTSKLIVGGQATKRECWIDVKTGHAACVTDDGPEAGRWGYDGKQAWFADLEGGPASSADAPVVPMLEAWWRSAGWTRKLAAGQSAAWRGEERVSGRLAERIDITLSDGTLSLWLDRLDHLPLKLSEPVTGGARVIRLSGWRHQDEFALPRHIEIATPGQPAAIESVQGMDLNHPIEAAHFSPPTERVADYQFPGDAASTTVPLKLANGHLFIEAHVGTAKDRLLFKLDTTSPALIDRQTAFRLNLVDRPDGPLGEMIRPRDFRVGGIAFRHFGLRLADLHAMSRDEGIMVFPAKPDDPRYPYQLAPIDGVIGADLVRRLIVEFDREGARLVFFKPKAFIAPNAASAIPLTLRNGLAVLPGRIDGIATELAIDSGSAASLILPRAFPAEHQLDKKWHFVPLVPGPGEADEFLPATHAASLELGLIGIASPVAYLRDLPQDLPRLGGDILRRFDVILDAPGGHLWLQQSGTFDQPDAYDRSGLSLTTDGRSVTVASVLPDSVAAHAHIKAGDEIVTIGTSRAAPLGLPAIRERLAGLYGAVVSLGIPRAGASGADKLDYVRLSLADPLARPAKSP